MCQIKKILHSQCRCYLTFATCIPDQIGQFATGWHKVDPDKGNSQDRTSQDTQGPLQKDKELSNRQGPLDYKLECLKNCIADQIGQLVTGWQKGDPDKGNTC